MINTNSNTDIMLSALHIDRGINFASELEVIFRHLESNPDEFNEQVASRLAYISRLVRGCFHQCYDNYEYNYPQFGEIDSLVDDIKCNSS